MEAVFYRLYQERVKTAIQVMEEQFLQMDSFLDDYLELPETERTPEAHELARHMFMGRWATQELIRRLKELLKQGPQEQIDDLLLLVENTIQDGRQEPMPTPDSSF